MRKKNEEFVANRWAGVTENILRDESDSFFFTLIEMKNVSQK